MFARVYPRGRHAYSHLSRRFGSSVPLLLDSISGTKKEVKQTGPFYSWYSCGPTVYDSSHVGHARTYVTIDLLQRILQTQFGINVYSAMGVTTVDDKIINKAKETNTAWKAIAERYESEFFKDMDRLHVLKPMSVVRVNEKIPEIIDFIKMLLDKEIAYTTPTGVYFDTHSPLYHYSKLVPAVEDEETQSRLAADASKRHPHDFALWKLFPECEVGGLPTTWSSPWGAGRPGWHIECSVNCYSLFGKHLDMHAGGVDLRFPHHCNEIAQCEACFGERWCDHMLHIGHIFIQGRKMSKSLKNFITIDTLLKDYSGDDFRMFCLLNHYAARVQLDDDGLRQAKETWSDLQNNLRLLQRELPKRVASSASPALTAEWLQRLDGLQKGVASSLCNDMDTRSVVLSLQSALGFAAKALLATSEAVPTQVGWALLRYVERLLGDLGFAEVAWRETTDGAMTPLVDELCAFRRDVRDACIANEEKTLKKDVLQLCDALRTTMAKKHAISIVDGNPTVLWVPGSMQMKEKAKTAKTAKPALTADVEPSELFRRTGEYSQFDASGIPTHDKSGKPLSASKLKKLRKQYETHKAIHEKWLKQKHM